MKNHTQKLDVAECSESENLLSREQGHRIHKLIKEKLRRLPPGGVLVLDFRNIRHATAACLMEILDILYNINQGEFQDRYVAVQLESANHDLKDCLTLALREKRRVIWWLDEKGNWHRLGDLTKALRDTLEAVREREEITAADISQRFDIPVNAASNRLKKLYDMGLVKRREKALSTTGGRQFIYRFLGN